ncbi:MAG: DUF998 domain-containing protein [Actinomycetaceae bacterium]|nr:DUF998 domain-containing protein [Actinomycetaceae bacterium]
MSARSSSNQHLVVACAISLGVAVCVYAAWLAQPLIDPALPVWTSFVSELAARGRPGSVLMRLGDAFAACAVLVCAWTGHRARLIAAPFGLLMVAFSVFTLLDAMFPMACAPSVSETCRRGDEAMTLGVSHFIHTFTSSLANAATVAAAGLWAWIRLRRGRLGLPAAIGVVLGLSHILTAVITGILALVHAETVGAWQRASLVFLSTWAIIALACSVKDNRS